MCGFLSDPVCDRATAVERGAKHLDEVESARITVATSDRGEIAFPRLSPNWCDRAEHLRYARESAGQATAEDVTAHHANGGDAFLTDLHNSGGAPWSLKAVMRLAAPYDDRSAHGQELIELTLHHGQPFGAAAQATIGYTTGEARVFAHLIALCDRVDLDEITSWV